MNLVLSNNFVTYKINLITTSLDHVLVLNKQYYVVKLKKSLKSIKACNCTYNFYLFQLKYFTQDIDI